MNPIVSLVKNKLRDGITHYSRKYNVEKTKIQLCILASSESIEDVNPIYYVLVDGKAKEKVTFLDLLNVQHDIMSYEAISTPYIIEFMRRMVVENNIELKKLYLIIDTDDARKAKNLRAWLYNGQNKVKELSLSEIMGKKDDDKNEND